MHNPTQMYGSLEKAQGISHRLHGFPPVNQSQSHSNLIFSAYLHTAQRPGIHNWANPWFFFQLLIATRDYSIVPPSKESLHCSIVLWLLILHVDRGAVTKWLIALGCRRLKGCPEIWGPKYLLQLLPSKTSSSWKIHFWEQLQSISLLVYFNSRVDTSLRDYISILYLIKGRCVLSINPISFSGLIRLGLLCFREHTNSTQA